jgi:hypothetical protein
VLRSSAGSGDLEGENEPEEKSRPGFMFDWNDENGSSENDAEGS